MESPTSWTLTRLPLARSSCCRKALGMVTCPLLANTARPPPERQLVRGLFAIPSLVKSLAVAAFEVLVRKLWGWALVLIAQPLKQGCE
jgi:hypothetical protein